VDHVVQAVVGVLAAVLRHLELGARGQGLVDVADQLAHVVGHADGAGFARACHRHADVRVAIAHREAVQLGEPVLYGGDLGKPDQFAAPTLDHDLAELGRRLDAADQPDALVFELAAYLAHRRRGVLGPQGGNNLGHADLELAQFFGAQQHAQFTPQGAVDVDDRNAVDAAEAIG